MQTKSVITQVQRKKLPPLPNVPKVVKTTTVVTQKSRSAARRRSRRSRNQSSQQSLGNGERAFFKSALLAPDILGPIRIPRGLSAARTGLGFDQTEFTISGVASPASVTFIQALSSFTPNSAGYTTVANTSTNFGSFVSVTPGTQFPSPTQIADVNLTSLSLVAYYVGNPLNVQGEVCFGSCIPVVGTATYAGLYFFPGTIKMPVARLIETPFRVSMRKLSPIANEFIPTTTGNADVDLPFLQVTGLPAGGTLTIVITRCFEYRSTTSSSLIIPYERVGPEFSTDVARYQDASADIANMSSTITQAIPEEVSGQLASTLGYSPALIGAMGAGSVISAVGNLMMRHVRNSGSRRSGPDFLQNMQGHISNLDEV